MCKQYYLTSDMTIPLTISSLSCYLPISFFFFLSLKLVFLKEIRYFVEDSRVSEIVTLNLTLASRVSLPYNIFDILLKTFGRSTFKFKCDGRDEENNNNNYNNNSKI